MGVLNFSNFVNENYPLGAANDPDAPWNEKELDIEYDLEFKNGEIDLIERVYSSRKPEEEDWEDEKTYIDPEYMDKFIADKLKLNIDDFEEGIEITDISEPKTNNYVIHTQQGDVKTDWDELKDIASGN